MTTCNTEKRLDVREKYDFLSDFVPNGECRQGRTVAIGIGGAEIPEH